MTDGSGGTVLVVCTANVCRSPLAQRLLQDALADAGWLAASPIESAGVRTEDGWEMCAVSAERLGAGDEGFVRDHRSRRRDPETVRRAGLVVTMEREQRSSVSRLAPGSQTKVFTLRELVALSGVLQERGAPAPQDLPSLARALHAVRGYAPVQAEPPKRRWFRQTVEPEDPLTIVDGHGLDDARHHRATAEVQQNAERLAAALRTLITPR